MGLDLLGEHPGEAVHRGRELGGCLRTAVTGLPAAQGIPVVTDEGALIDGQRHAVQVRLELLVSTFDGAGDEAVELRVSQAAFDVVGEPSVLGGTELGEGEDAVRAIVAAATPLLMALRSIGRSSGISPSRSLPKG